MLFSTTSLSRFFIYFKLTSDIIEFSNFKIRGPAAKMCVAFQYFNLERNYDVLKSNSPCSFLKKNLNFDESEAEWKMENSTHFFKR